MQTINGLPSDYRSACSVLLNDRDHYVFTRNVLVLMILLDKNMPIDEAVEMAVDLSYSVRLSSDTAFHVSMKMQKLVITMMQSAMVDSSNSTTISVRGRSRLVVRHDVADIHYLSKRATSSVPRDVDDAERAMHKALLHPSRLDYRDLYYGGLKPAHRLAASTYRTNGMTRPIGTNLKEFSEPNRYVEFKLGIHCSNHTK